MPVGKPGRHHTRHRYYINNNNNNNNHNNNNNKKALVVRQYTKMSSSAVHEFNMYIDCYWKFGQIAKHSEPNPNPIFDQILPPKFSVNRTLAHLSVIPSNLSQHNSLLIYLWVCLNWQPIATCRCKTRCSLWLLIGYFSCSCSYAGCVPFSTRAAYAAWFSGSRRIVRQINSLSHHVEQIITKHQVKVWFTKNPKWKLGITYVPIPTLSAQKPYRRHPIQRKCLGLNIVLLYVVIIHKWWSPSILNR